MNARYKIHVQEGYVEFWFEGTVTPSDLWIHSQQVWADPEWKAELNGLMDFSKATFEASQEELSELMKAMLADPRCSLARWAMIVSKASTFATLRMVDQLTDQQSTFRIFFSREQAKEWLLQPQKNRPSGENP